MQVVRIHKPRLLEGELFLYNGVIYIAKGYQHPPGMIVAYPRYSALRKEKLEEYERIIYIEEYYWDCIRLNISIIPRNKSYPYQVHHVSSEVFSVISTLERFLDKSIYLTGSSVLSTDYRDVDLVIYGAEDTTVDRLKKLYEKGVIKKPFSMLVEEYTHRHSKLFELSEYVEFKKNTILHGYIMGVHFNLKLYELEKGYENCIDPVLEYTSYTGPLELIKPINPHRLPGRYKGVVNGTDVLVETHRELYAELEPGKYLVKEARLEHRSTGIYLVPDHGVLRRIN